MTAPGKIPLYPISECLSETTPEVPFVVGRFEESAGSALRTLGEPPGSVPARRFAPFSKAPLDELPEFAEGSIEFSMLNKLNR